MIEFQFFNGCPNADTTLKNLKEVMRQLNIPDSDLFMVEVSDISLAETMHFQGSPTILVNGIDIYLDTKPDSFNFSCRVYQFDGKQTGVIPSDYIRKKIFQYKME